MSDINDTLFMSAARGEFVARPPVWLMRQAGRADPAYRALRAETPLELEGLFRHPELAARISLLPKRWGVDAVIFFQDILTPLSGMGAPFLFRPGPRLENPLTDVDALKQLHGFDVSEELPFIEATFRLLRASVGDGFPLLGFAGAPMTLLAFLLENGSPPATLPKTRLLLEEHPAVARKLLEQLTDMTAAYLAYQIQCGANAVQLFESAAHCLTAEEYREWALPCQQHIFEQLRGQAPTIFFARQEAPVLPLSLLAAAGSDILSLPASISIGAARQELGDSLRVQGNVDNHLLAHGSREALEHSILDCLRAGACRGHIFNLSHGLLPDTPFENILFLMDLATRYRAD